MHSLAAATMRTLGRFVDLVGQRFFMAVAIRALPIVVLELASLLLIRLFFMRLYLEAGIDPAAMAAFGAGAAPDEGYSATLVGMALLALLIVRLLVGYAMTGSIFDVALRAQRGLTTRLFANYLGQSLGLQRDSVRSEQNQTLFVSATTFVHNMLLPMIQLFVDTAVAAAVVVVLVVWEPVATLCLVGWLLGCLALQSLATARASRRVGLQRWGSLNRMRMIVDAALGDPRLTKLSASEGEFVGHFRAQARLHGEAVAKEAALAQVPVYARELVLVSSVCVLIAALAVQDKSGLALVGAIALFAAASVRLLPALQRFDTLAQKLANYSRDLGKIHADLAIEVERLEPGRPSARPLIRESLQLNDVSFRYPMATAPLLENVDLAIAPAERLLITGPSGAGKSTIILLLCGLIRPDSGTVVIDGASDRLLERIRNGRVALVPQDPFIANLSILENIAFPDPPDIVDRDRAAALLRKFRLDHSLDDRAGENGARLSGGERQRLALLRAIQRQPELLILDEATSQLDVETEAIVYRCIMEECADATIIAIAHRPPPLGLFGCHAVLENGRLEVKRQKQVDRADA